jgi:hypothetical protein
MPAVERGRLLMQLSRAVADRWDALADTEAYAPNPSHPESPP